MDLQYLLCHDSDDEDNIRRQQHQQSFILHPQYSSPSSSSTTIATTRSSDLIFSLPSPPQVSRSSESFIPRSSQQPTTRKRRRVASETTGQIIPIDTSYYYPQNIHHQTRTPWTPFEDTLLKRGYNEGLSWAMISSTYLPHRSRGCCWGRYKTLQMKLQRQQQKNQE